MSTDVQRIDRIATGRTTLGNGSYGRTARTRFAWVPHGRWRPVSSWYKEQVPDACHDSRGPRVGPPRGGPGPARARAGAAPDPGPCLRRLPDRPARGGRRTGAAQAAPTAGAGGSTSATAPAS